MTSVGVMASAVVVSSGVDVLLEPFNNTSAWSTTSSPPIIAGGRTGNALSCIGTLDRADYTIPAANESAVMTIGMAVRIISNGGIRNLFTVRSDAGGTQHGTVWVSADGTLNAGQANGTAAVSSASGLIVNSTWTYVEVQYTLGDSPNGAVTVRCNGTAVGTATSIDTKNAGTKTVYDRLRLGPVNATSGGTNDYDDLYITMGAGAAFKGDITIP